MIEGFPSGDEISLGHGQYHLAVAGGYVVDRPCSKAAHAPTRYREVVLTVSKSGCDVAKD